MIGWDARSRTPLVRRAARSAALTGGAALIALIGGCGSVAKPPSGRSVFVRDCQFCHSISGHPAPEQQGGDLSAVPMSRSEMIQSTAEMPKLHGPLTDAEVRAVVTYLRSLRPR